MKVAIYLPAYNAAAQIAAVLDRIPLALLDSVAEIFVVDNASTDDTAAVVEAYRRDRGLKKLTLIRNARNLGYGGSQKTAFRHAISRGHEILVMLHADGQYPPEMIDQLIAPLLDGQAELTFGSRLTGDPRAGGMPLYRLIGNKLLSGLANLVLRWNLSEYHSGYRAYDCRALARIPYEHCADYYHFDVDLLIQFRIAGLRVSEITIPTHYGDEDCHQNTLRTGVSILKTLGDYLLHRMAIARVDRFDVT